MTLTPRIVADVMRHRLGWPASKSAAIISAIPEALKATGRKIAADPTTRPLLVSVKTTAKINIGTDGKVSLTTGYQTYYFIKEFLEFGQMYLLPSATFTAIPATVGTVSATTDAITITSQRFAQGDRVRFTTTGTLPAGLALATDYYVKANSDSTGAFQVCTTSALGTAVDITDVGSGTHTISVQESADFPLQALVGPQLAAFPRALDGIFRYYYIQGDTLYVLPASTTGQVAFAVPYYPTNLAALPESKESELIFFDTMQQLLIMPPPAGK